ncbi:MAG: molecular chaperone TorD family protein [Eggerthellaceae bacterium]|nr:molecular chaperone TorD family protein [Eggerthellaceae bacterium]
MVEHSTQMESASGVADSKLLAALSRAFYYPLNGIAETTAELEALDAAAYPAFEGLIGEALEKSRQFDTRTAEQLAYTRLFIGSMRMEAPPYASYYLEREHTLFGQAAVEVESIYNQFGIELGEKEIEPPDHLRFLLAFLSLLAGRYEETGEEAFAEAYADFRDEYLFTWIDDCKKLIDMNAEEPYYPALMALTVAVLKDEGGAAGAPTGD